MATSEDELHGVIIVGGGICGLATAVALHRKGISSLVLEKADILRTTGAGISIQVNGWRALDQLKVGEELRKLAVPLSRMDKGGIHDRKITVAYRTEVRCLKRSDLVKTLAKQLPAGFIRFGCQIEAISLEPTTRFSIISTSDGTTIKAKILIGCDGSNSVVAKFLGLKMVKFLPMWSTRAFTIYPEGHNYGTRFLQLIGDRINFRLISIDDKVVCFNAIQSHPPKECIDSRDMGLVQQMTLQAMQGFPEEVIDVVRRCDVASLSFTQLCYRAPWDMILETFQEGTVTVAGDAMHVMGPFIGQGGSCGLEDAVVLARSLAKAIADDDEVNNANDERNLCKSIERGLKLYVKERRWRILTLSFQTFLAGLLVASTGFKKVVMTAVISLLFRDKYKHTSYNCGPL